ncbi:MAG: hypothetical protein EZS28_010169 [Streblomastix strix]|uniref:Uncharacterized protein n=1 Tax=Streblomastix strix TaxID=222440 RepID=A0A5J4WI11_9EUKA|nr:MAG: hypothetical protein EZS28_010169 [Streblomastix strix]
MHTIKTEVDTLLDDKLNVSDKIEAQTKPQDDALLLLKEVKIKLDDFIVLLSAQTIIGTKQFNLRTVTSDSKQGKSDASVFLASSGYMLVSLLVTQPQLLEIRRIASSKSKAFIFETQSDLNDWMAVQDNVAKLVIGDNLYIVDKEVTDYWWDGTGLKIPETELPDMTKVIATLRTATGGDDDLLLLKDDKIQLIDAYTKTETNNLFNSKANTGDSYTKDQDDTLLLKIDQTQLIDTNQKTEVDTLLDDKLNVSDQIDAYTKRN